MATDISLRSTLVDGRVLFCIGGVLLILAVVKLFIHGVKVPSIRPESATVDSKERANTEHLVPCHDPATKQLLGYVPDMTRDQILAKIQAARKAQQVWKHSSFAQRRLFLRILLKYITEHQEEICRVSAQDSGKPLLDANFGEITVTCEKIIWLLKEGEHWLKPEQRSSSRMMFYKSASVEFYPVGVVGAIVPWNYPFHNLFNPVLSALFAGNALVIKVSEHASWSAKYYGSIIEEALRACGAPTGLVQIVTGFSEAGSALVTGGVDKFIFVGSTGVGKKVMQAAAESLTPVVLELGGKDPIVICADADLDHATTIAMRGVFQNAGQNCAGCERLLVEESVFDTCLAKLKAATQALRQGCPLEGDSCSIDIGAIALPGLTAKIAELVDDAVSQGAKVLVGGKIVHPNGAQGDFFAPTLLTNVSPSMRIWKEEVFGPVMVVLPFASDEEAVSLVNNCAFGLGSNIFTRNRKRALAMLRQVEAGMTTTNDFTTSYMNQSLPFGGVKDSGFDRFAGVEGLRGVCNIRSVCHDRWPWLIRTDVPPLLQYPVKPSAYDFQQGLVRMFYAPSHVSKFRGLIAVLKAVLLKAKPRKSKSQ